MIIGNLNALPKATTDRDPSERDLQIQVPLLANSYLIMMFSSPSSVRKHAHGMANTTWLRLLHILPHSDELQPPGPT